MPLPRGSLLQIPQKRSKIPSLCPGHYKGGMDNGLMKDLCDGEQYKDRAARVSRKMPVRDMGSHPSNPCLLHPIFFQRKGAVSQINGKNPYKRTQARHSELYFGFVSLLVCMWLRSKRLPGVLTGYNRGVMFLSIERPFPAMK